MTMPLAVALTPPPSVDLLRTSHLTVPSASNAKPFSRRPTLLAGPRVNPPTTAAARYVGSLFPAANLSTRHFSTHIVILIDAQPWVFAGILDLDWSWELLKRPSIGFKVVR